MDHPLYQQAYQVIESKHLGRIAYQLKQSLKPAIRMDSSLVSVHPLPLVSRPVESRADLELATLVKRTPKNKIHECRRANADETAPGSGDPNADEQTPLNERRWPVRQ